MYREKKSRSIIKGIIYAIALLLQLALIVTVFVINSLTAKRAGVMRHVYTKRLQYEQGIFNQVNLSKHNIILIVLCILFVLLLINAIKRRRKIFTAIQIALGMMMGLLTIIVINSKFFIDMLAYPYFIIAFELDILIQTIVILIVIFKDYLYNKKQ